MSQGHGDETDPELSQDINTNPAHPARVYDYWLGGKDNFPADRALAELMIQAIPNMRAMAAANRA
ncbi:MAG TPA: SAM-dependent methyltransferase, partial [Actinomycetota bacterium]|nr:SAM-dependent methyltransferase [Actinomycetota bacterium]